MGSTSALRVLVFSASSAAPSLLQVNDISSATIVTIVYDVSCLVHHLRRHLRLASASATSVCTRRHLRDLRASSAASPRHRRDLNDATGVGLPPQQPTPLLH